MKTIHISDREQMLSLIASAPYCVVALNTDDGAPYAFPMNFHVSGETIYLHSGPDGYKMALLAADLRVTLCFVAPGEKIVSQHPDVACSHAMRAESVIVRGRVSFVEGDEAKRAVLSDLMQHYTGRHDFEFSDPAVRNVVVWRVAIDEISARKVGQSVDRRKL